MAWLLLYSTVSVYKIGITTGRTIAAPNLMASAGKTVFPMHSALFSHPLRQQGICTGSAPGSASPMALWVMCILCSPPAFRCITPQSTWLFEAPSVDHVEMSQGTFLSRCVSITVCGSFLRPGSLLPPTFLLQVQGRSLWVFVPHLLGVGAACLRGLF